MLSDAEYYQNLRDNMRQEYNIDLSDAEQGNSMEGDEYKHVPAAVKQEWNARWKKVRSAIPPTVELSKSERKIRLQAAVRRGKSEIISSKEGIPTIKLNDEMMNLCAALGADVESLAGGNLSANQARILINHLREQAEMVGMMTRESPAALEALADHIEHNVNPHGGITLLRGPRPRLRIMREEWAHFVQRLLGKGNFSEHVGSDLLAEHPVARKARPRFVAAQYGWLHDDALVFELSAKLIADAGDELGFGGREQDSFLDAYFKEILKQHGIAGLQKFWNIAGGRARASIQRVRSLR